MRKQPEDKFIRTDSLRLHYLEWGRDQARTMVLLHGIGDTAHIWDHFSRSAADRWRIIALDQRGHGLSDWAVPPAYRCDDYVSDLDRLIRDLQLTGIILMGHSMGALHATRYASLRPEKVSGLIHADIEPCPPEWNKKYLLNLYEELPAFYESVDEYVEEVRKNSPYAAQKMLYEIASFALRRGDDGRYRRRYDMEVLSHFDEYDLRPCLGDIKCPSLIIRGKESRVMGDEIAREMSRMIPLGRFVELPLATHPLHTDNPIEFQRAICDFLAVSLTGSQ
ncbi:MAG TPA: alpha/beta hydrolase [Syntrophales bacterium]|nr:alpha/beta hydrolase [Syntrophales bacterium]